MKTLNYLIAVLLSVSFAYAADVAYVLENNSPLQQNVQTALNDIGITYDVIRDSDIPDTDFSEYSLALIVEDVDNRKLIPFTQVHALFFDERIAEEVWSGSEASLSSSVKNIKVVAQSDEIFTGISMPIDGVISVYSGFGSEMHFLRIKPGYVTPLAIRTGGTIKPVIAKSLRNINGNAVTD